MDYKAGLARAKPFLDTRQPAVAEVMAPDILTNGEETLDRLLATRWEAHFCNLWLATVHKASPDSRNRRATTLNDWWTAHNGKSDLVVPCLWAKNREIVKRAAAAAPAGGKK